MNQIKSLKELTRLALIHARVTSHGSVGQVFFIPTIRITTTCPVPKVMYVVMTRGELVKTPGKGKEVMYAYINILVFT